MNKVICLLITAILSFVIPIGLGIYWKVKTKCKFKPFIVGAIIFVVFVEIVEAIVHYYVLSINVTTATFLSLNPIAYGIYAAIMAGLFEEVGRFVGFKVLLTNENNKETSVAYGIGHGGIECIMTLGLIYITYAIVGLGGSLGDPQTDALMMQTIAQIDVSIIPLAIFERLLAITTHISLSILVFKAVKGKGNIKYLFISILIHTLVDIPAGLYQAGLISSILIVEILTAVITIVLAIFAYKIYKNLKKE